MSTYQTPPSPTPPTTQPGLGELVTRVTESITSLVRSEIELTKAKGKRVAAKAGLGIGLLVTAGVLALYALGLLLGACTHLLALVLPLWASQLIVAVVLLVIVAVLAGIGASRLRAAQADVPDPRANLTQDLEMARTAVRTGLKKGDEQ